MPQVVQICTGVRVMAGIQISAKQGPDSTFTIKANTKTLCLKSSQLVKTLSAHTTLTLTRRRYKYVHVPSKWLEKDPTGR